MKTIALFAAVLLSFAARATEEEHEEAKPAEAAPSNERPHVDAAVAFLKGLAHSAQPGDIGAQGWANAAANASKKVALKVAGKDLTLDLAAKKSDAKLIKFHKVSTLRDGEAVKGVTVESVEVRVGGDFHTGKGTVRMEERNGKWLVTALEVE
jgi:hypothetical protein